MVDTRYDFLNSALATGLVKKSGTIMLIGRAIFNGYLSRFDVVSDEEEVSDFNALSAFGT